MGLRRPRQCLCRFDAVHVRRLPPLGEELHDGLDGGEVGPHLVSQGGSCRMHGGATRSMYKPSCTSTSKSGDPSGLCGVTRREKYFLPLTLSAVDRRRRFCMGGPMGHDPSQIPHRRAGVTAKLSQIPHKITHPQGPGAHKGGSDALAGLTRGDPRPSQGLTGGIRAPHQGSQR